MLGNAILAGEIDVVRSLDVEVRQDAPRKPRQLFDDGTKVYIRFPPGLAQGEAPPLFVIVPEHMPSRASPRSGPAITCSMVSLLARETDDHAPMPRKLTGETTGFGSILQ